MSNCQTHTLALMAGASVGDAISIHLLPEQPADVCDLICPACGLTLFVYYRHGPKEEHAGERQKERDAQ